IGNPSSSRPATGRLWVPVTFANFPGLPGLFSLRRSPSCFAAGCLATTAARNLAGICRAGRGCFWGFRPPGRGAGPRPALSRHDPVVGEFLSALGPPLDCAGVDPSLDSRGFSLLLRSLRASSHCRGGDRSREPVAAWAAGLAGTPCDAAGPGALGVLPLCLS